MHELIEARPARSSVRVRDLPLDGLVALITGGGQGLGEQICSVLAEAGAAVAVADVDSDRAMAVANEIHRTGAEAEFVALDVTDATACRTALEQLARAHGHVDVVVNNAGIDVTLPIDEMTIEQFDRVLAVNLRGPFVLSKLALPLMARQGHGHIVNVVSTASKRTWANASAYHASKWGLLGLSHALHVEGRERGVKVTAVVAGGMRTPFILERFPDVDPGTLQDPRTVAETIRFVLSQPDETVIPEVMVLPMRETSWP
jgi:NAD(P)-dependent dehydrogenase (short-subunit alcohol dehydrogenase family)